MLGIAFFRDRPIALSDIHMGDGTENGPMKYVYHFGSSGTDGNRDMKDLLGGKGANLAEMTSIGLPVPPGFTISTEACEQWGRLSGSWPEGLEEQVREGVARLERETGKGFGDPSGPMLISVRSGAAVSMPGMMDTVLNLGINERTLEALTRESGNPRFAWDSYRRFMQMFGDVVMNVPHEGFEEILSAVKEARGVQLDTELDVEALKETVAGYRELYRDRIGEDFPANPWMNPRAIKYRELNDIKGLIGTAVNVQVMVFGNTGEDSGTGVCFTRDPASGDSDFYGEYLMNAQGEDVVAGIRTPFPISTLGERNPEAYRKLLELRDILEKHYTDMQDIEFTIEHGKLYILQTRTGKRTVFAALNIAMDMEREGLIDRRTAVMRVPSNVFSQLFAPILDRDSKKEAVLLTTALNASPGGACGKVVFTAERAEEQSAAGEAVILCRQETSPEDIGGMAVSKGILTARGGMTSHAAVVARGMGTPCVAGASQLSIDSENLKITCGGMTLTEGDVIAIDGFTGEVFSGKVEVKASEIIQVLRGAMSPGDSVLFGNYSTLMSWTDEFRRLGVRTNAETSRDATMAILFGAEGIGLCRTEHMFFEGERIVSFRKLILVAEEVKRLRDRLEQSPGNAGLLAELEGPLDTYNEALAELLPLQRRDFEGLFEVLDGKPCTVRLLDPPLHEFLPRDEEGQAQMAGEMGVSIGEIRETVEKLHEFNPMLGHRGCRLGLTYPEVSDMQVRAIMEAAVNCRERGIEVHPEIMIPLVCHHEELRIARERAQAVVDAVLRERNVSAGGISYSIGTMIEIPRAAMDADRIADYADFFSFGTNDLTQMGCGLSRDDAGKFLGDYVRMGIFDRDPFASLDKDGVGKLVAYTVEHGREHHRGLKMGVCGEHGGDPSSIEFFHRVGLNYVSCSPYRVPVARLAAAQTAIEAD
jgi:pyruvate,orthophosphate dikinase